MLIVTDMRGRHLQGHIASNEIKVLPVLGATYDAMVRECDTPVWDLRPKYLIFLGGLCDLTVWDRTNNVPTVRDLDRDQLFSYVEEQLNNANQLADAFYPDIIKIFGEICGMDFHRYHIRDTRYDPEIILPPTNINQRPQQAALNAVIPELNFLIRQINARNQVPHPFFARRLHRLALGRRTRHRYHLLSDGRTPGSVLLSDWARIIHKVYTFLEESYSPPS